MGHITFHTKRCVQLVGRLRLIKNYQIKLKYNNYEDC